MLNKWDICFCSGQSEAVLVVSNNAVNHNLPVSTVIPFYAINPTDKIYPTEVLLKANETGLPKDSVVMVQQIRTVAQSSLEPPIGNLQDEEERKIILETIRDYFEL